MTKVPAFTTHSPDFYLVNVFLGFNEITVIPAYAFKNLSAAKATGIDVSLVNNDISNIESNAFSGVENAIILLNLNGNNLTHIPLALTELISLESLYLMNNPLVKFDALVLSNFSNIINDFKISIGQSANFPNELAFESYLTSLDMSNSEFVTIPSVVCRLMYLRTFAIDYSNLRRDNSSFFNACNHSIPTVTDLSLQYDQLTTILNLSSIFPHLEYLFLRGNALHFNESRSFAGMNSLATLDLSLNYLSRIPFAVNKAFNLHELDVSGNQIDTVKNLDLSGLQHLISLDLHDNPLAYISPLAFSHNPLLNEINIFSTNLGHVPQALLGLNHLRNVYLSSKPIVCSCQAMAYLKSWNVTSVNIHATCISGKSVYAYLASDLPNCP